MTLSEAIDKFRLDRKDNTIPPLWSDEEIASYLNDAIDEACERALLIEDRVTSDCCEISLSAGVGDYDLHPSVIKVKRVTYAGKKITETSVEQLDRVDPLWETRTGAPREYVLTGTTGFRLVPMPTAATILVVNTVYLTVYRTPLAALVNDGDTPEIPSIYHPRLMSWVYRCALLKNDAETLDKAKADEHESIFERAFGVRPDANVQRKHRDKRLPVTTYIF